MQLYSSGAFELENVQQYCAERGVVRSSTIEVNDCQPLLQQKQRRGLTDKIVARFHESFYVQVRFDWPPEATASSVNSGLIVLTGQSNKLPNCAAQFPRMR